MLISQFEIKVTEEFKIALFLGAGASVPFGKPTTKQLKIQLSEKYKHEPHVGVTPSQFYLYSMISFSTFEDVEHILQCVKDIDDFFSNSEYGGKYLLEAQYRYQHPNRPWTLNNLTENIKEVRTMIEDDVFRNYSWNHSYDQALVGILDKLFGVIRKHSREIHVFTTNYDAAIEEYCGKMEYRCIDGFTLNEYSNRRIWSGKYSYPPNEDQKNILLYKLHGSLTWKMHKQHGIEATKEEGKSRDLNYIENMLVYPTVSPKSGEEIEPYKTIRDEFKKFMDVADVCIVIGFSFRDEHINAIFSEFFKRGKKILIISPSAEKNIYGNLLKKDLPVNEGGIPLDIDPNKICSIRENKKLFTINQPLTIDNMSEISKIMDFVITGKF